LIQQLAKPAITVLVITSLLWILFRIIFLSSGKKRASSKKEFVLFLFVAWMVFVLMITLYPLPMTKMKVPGAKGVNFIPFENMLKEISGIPGKRAFLKSHVLENIIGNIFLFVPFGIFLPIVSSRFRSFGKVLLFGLFLSVSIEFFQSISRELGVYRSVDVDDVILNAFGIILGFIVFKIFSRAEQAAN